MSVLDFDFDRERTDLLQSARTIEPLVAQLTACFCRMVSGLSRIRRAGEGYQCLFSLAPGGTESSWMS